MDIKKFLQKQGIDLDALQKEGARVPKLLEALVTQNNSQVVALKKILKNEERLLQNQDTIAASLNQLVGDSKP